jgi:phenylalanyl-tRNA synthetase beta chain
MRVPLAWLREFVEVSGGPEDIANVMSVRGFAVDGIEGNGGAAVIDFDITANRPDCMSIVGMAREVATAYRLPLKWGQEPESNNIPDAVARGYTAAGIDIVLEDPDLCPRYIGAIADVTVSASPGWVQQRLQACGIRPISNIVDVTNYILLELGQPMHAFDLATIQGGQISVRRARPGEALATLDGQTRTLSADMLVIADRERAIAIAGVMGGADTEVTTGTRSIVLESAYFDPRSVRRTSKALGLKTEASMRFERGTDFHMPGTAMLRALELLERIGAGRRRVAEGHDIPFRVDTAASSRFDEALKRLEPRSLWLRRGRIEALLGTTVPDADVERLLTSLGFGLMRVDGGWLIAIPSRRVDVTREIDLIEEVARHYGFDRLPATFPALAAPTPPPDPRIQQARGLRSLLTGAGFSEAVTFGFIAESVAAPFAVSTEIVPIANPLSESFAVLRPSLLPGLITAVAHNRRRQQPDVRLFEIGALFQRTPGERRALACVWTGSAVGEHWSGRARDVDFYDIKGIVERIAAALHVDIEAAPREQAWLVPGRAAAAFHDGVLVATFGQLSPRIVEGHGIPPADPIYVAEFDLDAVTHRASAQPVTVTPLPKYPSITRDLSILVDESIAADRVRNTARKAASEALVRIREFDRYQGKGVPEGKVSLSLHFTFRSPDRTLTDAEAQGEIDTIVDALKREYGAVQR